jgi:hypothetical protein
MARHMHLVVVIVRLLELQLEWVLFVVVVQLVLVFELVRG